MNGFAVGTARAAPGGTVRGAIAAGRDFCRPVEIPVSWCMAPRQALCRGSTARPTATDRRVPSDGCVNLMRDLAMRPGQVERNGAWKLAREPIGQLSPGGF